MRARELPEGRGGFAYLYGFICHFALDHSCHPYIEKKIKEIGVTHAEIEVEFDRMLLAKRGHNPLTHRLAGHIPTDMTSAGTIAEFFPEVTAEEGTVYVFLSNRLCPNVWNTKLGEMNIRTDIQEVIYKSLK